MRKITALRPGKGRGKRVNVFLDGAFAFSLEADVAGQEGLRVEQVLSAEQIEALSKADHFQRCLNAAIHYLGYRPRSESEIRDRLRRRGFNGDTLEAVITRLKERELVDDVAFAEFWQDNRQSFKPQSRRLTTLELRRKGVDEDIIDRVVDAIDDDDCAYRAASTKARVLARTDYQEFRRRLGDYLKRRGFSYRVINDTVGRIWQELTNQSVESESG